MKLVIDHFLLNLKFFPNQSSSVEVSDTYLLVGRQQAMPRRTEAGNINSKNF